MGESTVEFKLGEHESTLQTLITGQERMQKDVQRILVVLAEKRGERRVGIWVAGLVGGLASALGGAFLRK